MDDISQQSSVEALAEEFIERKRRGESPAISEYMAKYPDLADEIEDIFPAMELMEDFKPASGDLSDESASSRPAVPSLKQVTDYRILKEIGRGGMGVVYEAEQQSLGRRVALKVLPKSSVGGTKMLDRFQREARAAAKMHHTNIVPVFEVGSDDQCAFYAMQLIQGQGLEAVIGDLRDLRGAHTSSQNESNLNQLGRRNSLAHSLVTGHFDCARLDDSASDDADDNNPALIETIVAAGGSTVSASLPGEGDLSTAEDNRRAYFRSVAEIGHQCAEALSYAHARGIIHRDIKPSNLLLDTNGVVWVTDFGLAKTNDVGLTQTGDILGTIRYMSPERFKGQCDNRADVYSLGLTLYEMLVLKPAYESPDRLKLIDIVTKTEVTAPRLIDSQIPRDLETIVLKACDKDPKRRYQSADDMAEDLQRFLNDEPILARRVSPTERVARWSRRNPWLATAMSVATAALIAITGISMVAAQTQAQLNEQLEEANDEQKELNQQQQQLNAALKKKTDEQNKTNQALVESNRSKEELIRDLKKSQSRLAEKQAEFVAEKGNLAESMLWLAKSYELADGQSPEYRRNLMSKLEAAGTQMPRLVSAVEARRTAITPELQDEVRSQMTELRGKSDEERMAFVGRMRDSGAFLRTQVSPVLSDDHSLMAVPCISQDETKSELGEQHLTIRIWDVKTSSFTGKAIEPKSRLQKLAVDSEKRILAAVSWEASDNTEPSDEAQTPQNGRSRSLGNLRGTLSMVVWSIDSGVVLHEKSIAEDVPFDRSRMRTPIRLRNSATELVRVSAMSNGEIIVKVHDVKTGKLIRRTAISLDESGAGPKRILLQLSRDGQRLVYHSAHLTLSRGFLGPREVDATLLCYDVDTGKQIGKTIRSTTQSPGPGGNIKLLTPDGLRVACRQGSGHTYRIETFDFEDGQKIGPDISLSRLSGFIPKLLNADTNGKRLAVCIEPPRATRSRTNVPTEHEEQFGVVQVFDIETGKAVTPRIPSLYGGQLVAMPSNDSTMTVRTASQIGTWQLPHSPLQDVVIPWNTPGGARPPNSASSVARMLSSRTTRLPEPSGELAVNRQGHILVASKRSKGIQIQRWDRKSGHLHSAIELPDTTSNLIGPFCPQGRYLLTIQLETDEKPENQVQVWDIETGTRRGNSFALRQGTAPLALSSEGNMVFLMRAAPFNGFARGNRFRAGRSAEFSVLNLKTGETQKLPEQSRGFGASARFSVDSRFVLYGFKDSLQRYSLQHGSTETFSAHRSERRGGFSTGLWCSSGDGQWIASIDNGTSVFLQSYSGTSQFGRSDSVLAELNHPASVTSVAFDPEGRVLVTGAADGVIRQWALPKRWEGDAAAINTRTQRHTGLALNDDGNVIAKDLVALAANSKGDTDLVAELSGTATSELTDEQLEALRLRSVEKWNDAEASFALWSKEHPGDWRADALRLRGLVRLKKFDESDAAWTRIGKQIGHDAAFEWLKVDAELHFATVAKSQSNGLSGARYNNVDPSYAPVSAWYNQKLLKFAADNATKASLLLDMAKACELDVELGKAAIAIEEAIGLQPESADIHYYRAHLMERLNRWDEALHSRQRLVLLEPEHRDAHYRVVASHLFSGNAEAFAESWAKFLSDKAEDLKQAGVVNAQIRDRVAKSRLVASGSGDEGLQTAIAFADTNFANDGTNRTLKPWGTLTKGIAEYRRGEEDNLAAAIEHLDAARTMLTDFPSLGANNFSRGVAITRFFAAMAHHKLGRPDIAKETYLDGLDRHSRDEDQVRISSTQTWADWQLAEVARREAAELLKIDEDSIDQPVPDTSEWKVVLEEDFDDGLNDEWKQITGKWTIVDGAACGTLEQPPGAVNSAYGRLEREIAELPSTFEVQYEVWTSAPMLAACYLRKSGPTDQLAGHRVALASYPDRQFTNQGKPGKGVNLVAQTEFGHWAEGAVNDFEVKPDQHYNVRIIRQPQRITVFIDGKQVMSHRVRNIETKTIRFFARGENGTKMFVDNIRIRIPAE